MYTVDLEIKNDDIIQLIEDIKNLDFDGHMPVFNHKNTIIVGYIRDIFMDENLEAIFIPNLSLFGITHDDFYINFNSENKEFILENSK